MDKVIYQHLVQFLAKPGLTQEEVIKFAIFTLKDRLKKEYSAKKIKKYINEILPDNIS